MPELSLLEKLFVFFQHIVPQKLLSRLTGTLADSTYPPLKNFLIKQFAKQFDVDLSAAEVKDITAYNSFNAFFTRALDTDARSVDNDPGYFCSPVDGTISQSGPIDEKRILQAKGHYFDLTTLMANDSELIDPFIDGSFATIYLSPRDYHRIHMPYDGKLIATHYVPGKLFSVNDTTAQSVPGLFARNERLVCLFESEHGVFAMVLVGAMIVAGIETVWAGQVAPQPSTPQKQRFDQEIFLQKGQEMGRFKLGSTVILLTPAGMCDPRAVGEHWCNRQSLEMGQRFIELAV